MTITPSTSGPPNNTFIPRDVFAVEGALVFRVDGVGNVTLFAALPGCLASDHNGITFDHFGTYGFDLIVTCREGSVFRVNGAGTVTQIASIFPPGTGEVEGPAVVPPAFGPHGGEIWVADEENGAIHTVGLPPTYTVTQNVLSHPEAEGVYVIPNPPCTFCGNFAFGLAEQQPPQFVWLYPISDFVGLGGNVILTSESQADFADTSLVSVSGGAYVKTSFGPRVPFINEGASSLTAPFLRLHRLLRLQRHLRLRQPLPRLLQQRLRSRLHSYLRDSTATATPTPTPTPTVTPTTCGTAFAIGDLDAVVGNKVTFWGAQWWKDNHLSGGRAPASFKGFVNCTNPNPPACGGTWTSDPGNSGHPPDTVPADMTVIVSSLITKSGPVESGDIPMLVTIHTDPGYGPDPRSRGHRNGNGSYMWRWSSPAWSTGSTCSTCSQTLNRPDSPKRPRRVPLVAGVFAGHHRVPGGRVHGVVVVANSGGWEKRLLLQSEANHRCPVGAARKNPLSALLLDVDLTHPFLLPNDLDLMA